MTINQNLQIQNNMNELLSSALEYLSHGFSVIPVSGKTPLVEWTEFQNRKPAKEEVTKWFSELNPTGIGIITGKISGIIVVDIEKDGSTEDLPETVKVKTGGSGFHYYYRYTGISIKNSVKKIRDNTDIRSDGGYVIAPPSIHPNGS